MTPVSLRLVSALALAIGLCASGALAQSAVQSAAPSAVPAEVAPAEGPAKNVILFLADAGGVASVNAASLMAYGEPLKLHIQQWPNLGLSETSPVDDFVSDSANGMSSIVTGVKTRNGVISQGPDAERGRRDGTPTKTVLEYAEEHGLLTGVVTNQPITDATPAATYAHANDRSKWGEIFPQAFAPRFGDGVDVLIGAGRAEIAEQMAKDGISYDSLSQAHDRPIYASLEAAPTGDRRPVVVADQIDVRAATLRALDLLQAGGGGYLLVVEWDAHTDDPRQGLQNIADLDRLIAEVETRVDLDDTLMLFTADHSFGLQVDGGRRGQNLLEGYEAWKARGADDHVIRLDHVLVNRTHTAEEVATLAVGAGADQVRGYFPNTHLFDVMMKAFGWTPSSSGGD
ncbi:alkaline phosphatase [Brevundimonas sp. SL130]|uniref:alkaline phosphatase n=1 Tax=Brevundimonas sp. SL130 TaxID=2995143 RepID=UPI00226CDB29|nr:alkaline phosphatase [Brevundimonas sp. SL130]WAC59940.1 alkaline phosphatase [Brevundimonas sp. SL130]